MKQNWWLHKSKNASKLFLVFEVVALWQSLKSLHPGNLWNCCTLAIFIKLSPRCPDGVGSRLRLSVGHVVGHYSCQCSVSNCGWTLTSVRKTVTNRGQTLANITNYGRTLATEIKKTVSSPGNTFLGTFFCKKKKLFSTRHLWNKLWPNNSRYNIKLQSLIGKWQWPLSLFLIKEGSPCIP